MRDPFVGYDSWLERPYQDECAKADEAEWTDEHTTFTSDCCGVPVTCRVS